MARPLVIGPEEQEKLKALRENAENNVFSFDDLLDIKNGAPPPGDREGFSCVLPVDFKVVYTVEMMPRKDGSGFTKIRHMSMSVPTPGRLPSVQACEMVMEELGFKNKIQSGECMVHVEQEIAVNVMEAYK